MMKNTVANLALGILGTSLRVVDFSTDKSQQASVLQLHFPVALDSLLEEHDWHFASTSAVLVLHTEYPEGSVWKYEYQEPSDAVFIRELARDGEFSNRFQYEQNKQRWEQKYSAGNNRILTNVEDAHARYTARIPDDANFPNYFGNGLAAKLAMMIAPSVITNNFPKVRDTLMTLTRNEISKAISLDLNSQPQRLDEAPPAISARWRC